MRWYSAACAASGRGWVAKQCSTEEGAERGQKGRGPRPHRGPTVGVHVQRWVSSRTLMPLPFHRQPLHHNHTHPVPLVCGRQKVRPGQSCKSSLR